MRDKFKLLRVLIENKGLITRLNFNYLQNNLTTLPFRGLGVILRIIMIFIICVNPFNLFHLCSDFNFHSQLSKKHRSPITENLNFGAVRRTQQ